MKERRISIVLELFILASIIGFFYLIVKIGMIWSSPLKTGLNISLDVSNLPFYAFLSVSRILIAYVLSLVFSISYGYVAAHNKTAERFMIPVLDVLQSIPVLSFLPGVMLAVTSLFPGRQMGLELASIILIFTGEVWNIAFGFYISLKTIPTTLVETAKALNLSRWQRFIYLELPFSIPGLVWNSMIGVAGGWFFLMACEMFMLGNKDFRLPGLGSYLQVAASSGNIRAIIYGIATMVFVIFIMDFVLWKPLVAYSDRFRFEEMTGTESHGSIVYQLIIRSRIIKFLKDFLREIFYSPPGAAPVHTHPVKRRKEKPVLRKIALTGFYILMALLTFFIVKNIYRIDLPHTILLLKYAGFSLSRVALAILIACAWTIPVGVAIGLRPKLTKAFQPVIQIFASIPATALFPVILMVIVQYGGGLNTGAIFLMLFSTQWYILFNVIAGSSSIPRDLREVVKSYNLSAFYQWKYLILPGIFPYLLAGLIAAWGGAWNATIVAEYTNFAGKVLSIPGLGSVITKATNSGDITLLISATTVMAVTVMLFNKFVWKRLYSMAEEKFKLG